MHVPHAARDDLIEKYRKLPRGKHCKDDDYLPVKEIPKGKKISSWRLQYAAMVEQVDEGLGAIVEVLQQRKQLDNTIIIFTSDNGGGLTPNGPLRGGKATLYEGGLRVPFVVAGPGVQSGVQCDLPIAQWDLLPTIHELSKSQTELPSSLDGGSLTNLFKNGDVGSVSRSGEVCFHYPCYFAAPLTVIRLGDYKLMEHLRTGEQKLFDVSVDYGESKNIIDERPIVALQLKAAMSSYLEAIDAENLDEVYQARFSELDRFEVNARKVHQQRIERAKGDQKLINQADQKLELDLARFKQNRAMFDKNARD